MIEEGQPAPTVESANQDGEEVEITYEQPTVLYFYPEDGTPGCETEAEQFQRERETYRDAGVEVYGVSRDTVESHQQFSEELDLSFDLLADPDGEIGRAFDVSLDQDRYDRMTFVVVDGRIHAVYEDVNPDGHARDVLMDFLEEDLVSLD
jgi:peroxiredoxin Q/BCP